MTDPELRRLLVDRLERTGVLTDARVRRALLAVPRHRFIPHMTPDAAYEDRAIAIKERAGEVISSISQPSMIVQMLQMLDVAPGDRILEIGTGSGYHAALLAELTGPEGEVVTLDVEPDLTNAARAVLDSLGYARVRVENADALDSIRDPFDRIIVTARAQDIDEQWWRLLRDGGRIVVPLDIGYGGERAIGFVREGSMLRSVGSHACAFLGIRSDAAELRTRLFFPNKSARYGAQPDAHAPLSIVAVERREATAEAVEGADVIVARSVTIFALRF